MIDFVTALHFAAFCWWLSRVFVSRDAWTHDGVDATVGVVAAATWTVMVIESVGATASGELSDALARTSSGELLAVVLGVIGVYVVVTWVSVQVREYVGREL